MLFHIEHIHTPELCPSNNPKRIEETVSVLASDEHAKETGEKVLERYIAPTEHCLFFIVESESYEAITDFLETMMKMGTPRITPVSELGKAIKPFLEKKRL
jgi:hypothetical protein